MILPPSNVAELMYRAQQLAGLTLAELAANLAVILPKDLKRDKGMVGQMLEQALGASAGSKAEPDFPHLGIELKTLPIDSHGKPLESTYVCVAALTDLSLQRWQESWVCRKLQQVLWVPIWAERSLPLGERVIGSAFLWQPDPQQQQLLQQDWEELMELIVLGGIDQIRGAHGKVLQLRPKAANAKALTAAIGHDGQPIQTLPRGFYLKANFTADILQRQFGS
ncbi:MAG: DNA mismatch repair endonuclease MutH [Gammaproteobacteria bacterium]|nr:DNA mismatch repair endonuclease MutH [Gammaproteobacteria bacterium]MBU2222867.1 DNA mismatch repair endonuclease MutH [Gammaproteobacteria bacterium]MBU2278467.1 DNA mismatch repair endonuclease MutH [Gammaproteobacteria bacterium]MBU2425903.1 DNA mismatch repair endonuclease MutH [Gammaproteobacteria bacterium]